MSIFCFLERNGNDGGGRKELFSFSKIYIAGINVNLLPFYFSYLHLQTWFFKNHPRKKEASFYFH